MPGTRLYRVKLVLDTGVTGECGAIEHNGTLWLVPNWVPHPTEGYTTPERMIPLEKLGYKILDPTNDILAIDDPVPSTLLAGPASSKMLQQYGVLIRPDLRFRTGGTLN